MEITETTEFLTRTGLNKLLEIKDSDIRILTLQQTRDAIDKSIHIGGAFSATIPLVALYYGGIMQYDVANPTQRGQDMFVLSKGHAVAAIASMYADLGYFDRSVLKNSRGAESILNGHPGPILPGFHLSTGPLGQGLSAAQGLALVGKRNPRYDAYCLTGDGELQEGIIWEAIMYSSYKKLDNLCVLVDKNVGQLDDTRQLVVPLLNLNKRFAGNGWRVFDVDGMQYGPIMEALKSFKYGPREGKPTAIICHTRKGFGGFSNFMIGHKVVMADDLTEQEMMLQNQRRTERAEEFSIFFNWLAKKRDGEMVRERLMEMAKAMNLEIVIHNHQAAEIRPIIIPVKTRPAPPRNKKIEYDASQLPKLDKTKEYRASDVITAAMKVFARDPRVISIDADLASTSGLEPGVGYVDTGRALNVGIAEPNMMGIGEAYALMGYKAWVSTFCPFFDWRVLRRIAIGYQERLEAIGTKGGWLSEGHGIDMTFIATAPNFETNTNGATHMGNDDVQVFNGIAQLKIIDVSCPNQLLGIMKWILEGNRGLVYVRIMRAASGVIYGDDYQFEFGKGYIVKESPEDKAIVISSGRGVYEALAAASELEKSGIKVGVVDMPSIDEKLLSDLYDSGKLLVIAEQNNGFIWPGFQSTLFKRQKMIDISRLLPINCLDASGRPQFIHSATYQELLHQFGLAPGQLVKTIKEKLMDG